MDDLGYLYLALTSSSFILKFYFLGKILYQNGGNVVETIINRAQNHHKYCKYQPFPVMAGKKMALFQPKKNTLV